MIARITLLCLVIGSTGSSCYGEVLFEQSSIPIGNPAGSSVAVFSSLADAIIEESQAWDNFSLASPANITQLNWKGAFFGPFNPDDNFRGDNDFLINIHGDDNGRPDLSSSLFTFDLDGGTAGRNDGTDLRELLVPNETESTGGAIANYEADLSFELGAGNYWLSIQASQTFPSPVEEFFDPAWAWVFSGEGSGGLFSYDEAFGDTIKPGIAVPSRNTSFSLLGDFINSGVLGDFDLSGSLDVPDIDLLAAAIRTNDTDLKWDVDNNGTVNVNDHSFWISELKNTLPGDTNLDQTVGFDDFLKLSGAFGQEGGWGDGNFDTNTEIDFGDFLGLSANFGVTVSAAATTQAVPEPSAAVLGGLGLICLGLVRRRR